MTGLEQALQGAWRTPPAAGSGPRRVIVAGGAGVLGAAVVERALGSGGFAEVAALVERPWAAAPRRLHAVRRDELDASVARADTAIVVFDRARGRHGREAVFVQPQAAALPALAAALQRAGVQRLVVVLPHAPALLPQALRLGLASLDEQAVAALGFEHLVFVRPAQRAAVGAAAGPWLQRVADALLRQLHWMVPVREQPLRADQVAAFVVALARGLPAAAPGTRVAPPDLVWQAAQSSSPGEVDAVVARWLADGTVPAAPRLRQRW